MAMWTKRERTILSAVYPSQGAHGCRPLLKGRSKAAINQKAQAMGVSVIGPLPKWHTRQFAPRVSCHPLVRDLFAEMANQKLTIKAAGKRAGVNAGTIAAWRKSNPSLPNFIAVANTVGLDLCFKELEP